VGNSGANWMNDQIFKQANLFGQSEQTDTIYSKNIKAPTYEPSNKKPHLIELLDSTKTKQLIREIEDSTAEPEEKAFLIEAARRHSVFNYEKIADYYAHSPIEVQHLMERSALVIIDFEKAIHNGFVKLCEKIKEQYIEQDS
jgi:hypothetical protein